MDEWQTNRWDIYTILSPLNAEKMTAAWILYEPENLQCLYCWSWNVQMIVKHQPHNSKTVHPGSQLAEGFQ